MIITSTVGKIDMAIGRFEGPVMAYMMKEEADYAKQSLKNTLFTVKKSKHYSESVGGLTGIGNFIPEPGAVPFDEFEEGPTKTFTHKEYMKGLEIKRKTIDDSRLIDMENTGGLLIESWNKTQEDMVHAIFNNPTATTFSYEGESHNIAGADTLALGSAAHTSHTGKGANQSNLLTAALSVANLKIAEELMKNFKTDIGTKGNWKADTLLVPYELRNDAWEIVQSIGKVNSGDNNANPYKDKFNVIVSDWLTDANNWFLIDSRAMKRNLYWIDRVPLEVESQKDFNTKNWKISGYARMSFGFVDWRWCVVNNVA